MVASIVVLAVGSNGQVFATSAIRYVHIVISGEWSSLTLVGHNHLCIIFLLSEELNLYRNYILCDEVCQWLAVGQWFSPGNLVSSSNKNWLPRYNWNIVESDIKHHKPYMYVSCCLICLFSSRGVTFLTNITILHLVCLSSFGAVMIVIIW